MEPHIDHALRFADAVEDAPGLAVDLGSGGGLPGLPLALLWPASSWLLVESRQRRAAFLHGATSELGIADRVVVLEARAEDVGRDPAYRATADLVVARSFGSPAAVAECAAPLLVVGGSVVVSEPPDVRDRWPDDGLGQLGLGPASTTGRYVRLRQVSPCPVKYPRRVGVPAKRPLW